MLKHIRSRIYQPATLNGEPVEENRGVQRMTFYLTNLPRAAGKHFYRRYKKSPVSSG